MASRGFFPPINGMDDAVLGRFAEVLGDREWRLNHLYWVGIRWCGSA